MQWDIEINQSHSDNIQLGQGLVEQHKHDWINFDIQFHFIQYLFNINPGCLFWEEIFI